MQRNLVTHNTLSEEQGLRESAGCSSSEWVMYIFMWSFTQSACTTGFPYHSSGMPHELQSTVSVIVGTAAGTLLELYVEHVSQ